MNYNDNNKVLQKLKGMPNIPMRGKEKEDVLNTILQFEERQSKREKRNKKLALVVKGLTASAAVILLILMTFTNEGNQLAEKVWTTITSPLQEKEVEPSMPIDEPIEDEVEPEEENVISHERPLQDAIYFLTLIKEKDVDALKIELMNSMRYKYPDLNENSPDFNRLLTIIDEKIEEMIDLYHQLIDFDAPFDVSVGGGYVYDRGPNEFYLQIGNLHDRDLPGYSELDESQYFLGEQMAIFYLEDQPIFSSRIFDYYPMAYMIMNEYIEAIKDEDLKAISYLLEPWRQYSVEDDAAFPDDLAQGVIKKYKETMEIKSLKPHIIDFDPIKSFIVSVKDENENSHSFNIMFDGHTEVIMDEKVPYDITITYKNEAALVELQDIVNEILETHELKDYVVKWKNDPTRDTTFIIKSHNKGTSNASNLKGFEDNIKELSQQ